MEALGGLHHVTAITANAAANLEFYTGVLGMRLVKKTVNQDDVSAYHLFYADAKGSPGTDLTFFDWPLSPPNVPGAGSIGPVGLRVGSTAALEFWQERLSRLAVTVGAVAEREGGRRYLAFTDPEGQRLELVDDRDAAAGPPWKAAGLAAEHQVRGLDSVALISARPQLTTDVLTQVLDFRPAGERELAEGGREYDFAIGAGGPGAEVRLRVPREVGWAQQGRGGVHHVAFRVRDSETQLQWRARIAAAGLQPTPVIDRFYFRSVYFREPGGILYEIATDGPGFTADEEEATMGGRLALPPFLEADRQRIEEGLKPLPQ
ncbi:MAG: ring-cleaving dioxygenase [Candidatus Dormibacteraceae bacterium]